MVNWDAGANLHRAVVTQHEPGKYAVESRVMVYDGTLEGAVRRYLQQPESQRPRFTILVGLDAGTKKTILDWNDIDELAAMPDFPGRKT